MFYEDCYEDGTIDAVQGRATCLPDMLESEGENPNATTGVPTGATWSAHVLAGGSCARTHQSRPAALSAALAIASTALCHAHCNSVWY